MVEGRFSLELDSLGLVNFIWYSTAGLSLNLQSDEDLCIVFVALPILPQHWCEQQSGDQLAQTQTSQHMSSLVGFSLCIY